MSLSFHGQPMSVTEANDRRMSCREFIPDEAPSHAEIHKLLADASRAPSGANMQPWRCYVVSGAARESLIGAVGARMAEGELPSDSAEFAVYPTRDVLNRPENHAMRDRRRKLGFGMYELMDVKKGDRGASFNALRRNYEFFGAPVGIIVTVDKAMDKNAWGHAGCFLATLCLLAEACGMATCLQEAWSQYAPAVNSALSLDTIREAVWCTQTSRRRSTRCARSAIRRRASRRSSRPRCDNNIRI